MLKATPAVAVGEGWVAITNWVAAAGLITTLLDVAEVRTGELVNWIVIVSALSSARSVNVAMPPLTVTVVVPSRGPDPDSATRGDLCRVVAGLKIAVLVFDVDDRLRAESHAGRRRRRGLRVNSPTGSQPPG